MATSNGPYQPTSSNFDPFLVMRPNSVKADKEGLKVGKVILDNAKDIGGMPDKLKKLQEAVDKKLDDDCKIEVELTYFKNWADTVESVVFYAKPTRSAQVVALVQAAKELTIKVGLILQCVHQFYPGLLLVMNNYVTLIINYWPSFVLGTFCTFLVAIENLFVHSCRLESVDHITPGRKCFQIQMGC